MKIYAVFINEINEWLGCWKYTLVGLYSTKEKAMEVVASIPKEANPHMGVYELDK